MQHLGGQFTNSAVAVDNQTFTSCLFKDCTLIYSGGELPSFIHCTFDRVNFSFQGAAGATLSFMAVLYQMGFKGSMEATFNNIKNWKPDPSQMSGNRSIPRV